MSKKISVSTALQKAASYCVYQERSEKEVRQKLYHLNVPFILVEEIIEKLYKEDFINEERYARCFVSGKFRVKKWGRIKIRHRLQENGIAASTISKALNEINSTEYYQTIYELATHKIKSGKKTEKDQANIYRFLKQRGFESELILNVLQELKF